jgi:hypothetical protein
MKICVFMSDNRPLVDVFDRADYNSLAACINYEYCKMHSYDFFYYRPYLKDPGVISLYNCIDPNTGEERHAAWSKLLSTIKVLEREYDYVVYIDSDCIFRNFNISMESFIEPHADKDMIFLNNKPWGDNLPCSGFYICKVGDSAKESMKRWYGANWPAKNKKHPWEQDALWNMYKSMNIAIVDIWMFKEESGQMLRHIGSHEGFNRTPYFKNVIRANSIKYTENIKYITVVDYDTAGDLS